MDAELEAFAGGAAKLEAFAGEAAELEAFVGGGAELEGAPGSQNPCSYFGLKVTDRGGDVDDRCADVGGDVAARSGLAFGSEYEPEGWESLSCCSSTSGASSSAKISPNQTVPSTCLAARTPLPGTWS